MSTHDADPGPDGGAASKVAEVPAGGGVAAPRSNADANADYGRLSTEIEEAVSHLRRRLRAALDSVLPVEYGARSLGRFLNLERMTAWRCWTIAHVADPAQAIQAMPGRRAWSMLRSGLVTRGVEAELLEALDAAIEAVERLFRERNIDRPTLRALAAGALDSDRETAAIVEARRHVARGNSKVYGVQAKLVVVGHILAPGPAPGTVSLGTGAVFEGLGRSRPGVAWPIMRQSAARGGEEGPAVAHGALGDGGELPSVIRSVSTEGIVGAEIRPGRPDLEFTTIDLCDVPASRNRRLRVAIAEYIDRIDLKTDAEIDPICLQTPAQLPIDALIVDLLVHRGCARYTEPSVSMLGMPVVPEFLDGWVSSPRLPLEVSMRPVDTITLPSRFKAVSPGYHEAVTRVVEAQSKDLADFEVFRVVVPYPPMWSLIAINFEVSKRIGPA